MKWKNYVQSWKSINLENKISRLVICALAFSNILLVAAVINQNSLVIFTPPTLHEETAIAIDSASEPMHRAMGLYVAGLIGNVTPHNAKLVKESLGPLLDAGIYTNVMKVMDDQILALRQDKVSTSFRTISVEYEKKSGKVFVHGQQIVDGLIDSSRSLKKTYEFIFKIRNYQPQITHIDNYRGTPRNEEWRKAQEKK
ncbi:hypothetical protein GCM10023116_16010 [Kistimonas scapharcae]|uniref:Uncharacterized protein n=1 Tax=Kistimonas scapharcae TaxID=1036133 RepID=A0ABP8V0I5_9GAMM